jgi:hypothetical protein
MTYNLQTRYTIAHNLPSQTHYTANLKFRRVRDAIKELKKIVAEHENNFGMKKVFDDETLVLLQRGKNVINRLEVEITIDRNNPNRISRPLT